MSGKNQNFDPKKLAGKIAGAIPAPIITYVAFELGLKLALKQGGKRAKRLEGRDETIQFRITDIPGGAWHLVVKDEKIALKRGEADYPTGVMTMKAKAFKDLAIGKSNPVSSVLSGDVHVTGTLDHYRVLEAVFGKR